MTCQNSVWFLLWEVAKNSTVSYYRAPSLSPALKDVQPYSLWWRKQSLSITLNFKPKPETEFLTCLPDYKAAASWMIKTAAGNVLKPSWSVRQLNICLNPSPHRPPPHHKTLVPKQIQRESKYTGIHRSSMTEKSLTELEESTSFSELSENVLGWWGHLCTESH